MQRADAFIKLQERIEKGRQLKNREATSADEYLALKAERAKWSDYNHELLKQMFTTDEAAKEYSFFGFGTGAINASWQTRLDELREGIDESVHRLESIQERLEIIPAVAGLEGAPVAVSSQVKTVNSASPTRAFIVHGHDEAAKEKVARMLEKQKITAIILHEQASLGKSIVEKLEHYSDVAFAIVLLTPDDEGRAKKGAAVDLRPRARQNVILELGYFTARLGRQNVCALVTGGVEIPSDFDGVVYVPMDDAGAWRYKLAREMRAAGFAIDLNTI